ncbi:histidine kinase [Romeria aff. gracilis LEGE 07310]|uniref:Histidine kinase n=1 Tax=Vasconcelosia minhoensis LEGE 07310 TaxID=915328 RepID=A0A8J7AM00_9CYAN|nr:histidine kinase [Romeria gracilis]MBE9076681.1 histidine kinase [Romeria aff. gracilis LEGE 07310]
MTLACHLLVENNPIIVYASRNGAPDKVMPKLSKFLATFAEERETAGEFKHTPACLVAQMIVRFGFENFEDDFSNLRADLNYYADVAYLYYINSRFEVSIWQPQPAYVQNPMLGLEGCQQVDFSAV